MVFTPGTDFDHLAQGASQTINYTYIAKDQLGALSNAAFASFTVTGVNDAPVANHDGNGASTNENTNLTILASALLANDRDVDDGSVLSIASITGDSHLSLVGGNVVFTPGTDFDHLAQGASQTINYTYIAKDQLGALSNAASASIIVTGLNDAPVANHDGNGASTNENANLTILASALLANDKDVDDGSVLSIASITGDSHLSLVGGNVVFTPGTDFDHLAQGASQTINYTYIAKDQLGALSNAASASFTVTGVNDAPVANHDGNGASTNENANLTVLASALLGNDRDVDDGSVLSIASITGDSHLSLVGGNVVFTPGTDFDHLAQGTSQTINYTYIAKDQLGALSNAASASITVTGLNDAPVANHDGNGASTNENANLTILASALLANDKDVDDGSVLSIASITGDSHLSLVGGNIVFTPGSDFDYLAQGDSQTINYSYIVKDQLGALSNIANASITVTGLNDAPIAGFDFVTVSESIAPNEAVDLTGNVLANDSDVDAFDSLSVTPFNAVGSYGTLNMPASGFWTYELNNTTSESLSEGQEAHDIFTYTISDGKGGTSSASLNITIIGTNDAAVIGGNAFGSVTENGTSVASGQLTVTDVDTGQASFVAIPAVSGNYGSFTMNSSGAWTYNLNNSLAAVQALPAGATVIDNFIIKSLDGTARNIAITINGTNDGAIIGGNTSGAVREDLTLSATGQLTVTDVDTGQASFSAVSTNGTYGSFSMNTNGLWSYNLNNTLPAVQALAAGATATETFTVRSVDNTAKTIIISITGTNDAAVIGGNAVGSVTENGTLSGTGQLTVTDVDTGQASFSALSANGTYGSFSMNTTGLWTYNLNNASAAVQALAENATVTDTFTVRSVDGTMRNVVITVHGTNDAAVITGNAGGSVAEDGALLATGQLSATDVDAGQASFALSSQNGDYGTFSMNAAGQWTYNLNNSLESTQALAQGENVTDTFTVSSFDGTATEDIVITVNGTNDAPIAVEDGQVAITNENANLIISKDTFLDNDTDADNNSVISIASISGTHFSLNGDGDIVFTPGTDFDYLSEGETAVVTFTYVAKDETGALSAPATASILVTGTNDVVALTSTTDGHISLPVSLGSLSTTVLSASNVTISGFSAPLSVGSLDIQPMALSEGEAAHFSITSLGYFNNALVAAHPLYQNDVPAQLIIKTDGSVSLINNNTFDFLPFGKTLTVSFDYQTATGLLSASFNITGTDVHDVNFLVSAGTLSGGIGNDTLIGSPGNDILNGDSGNDTLIGGLGSNFLNGGLGFNTADYSNMTVNPEDLDFVLDIDLTSTGAQFVGYNFDRYAFLVTPFSTSLGITGGLSTIQNIQGSSYNDSIIGDVQNNRLDGGAGDDFINGGAGTNILTGGAGNDTVSYANAEWAVTVDLNPVTLGFGKGATGSFVTNLLEKINDTLSGFENIIGSDFNDTLTGDGLDNVIAGSRGGDTINGGAGNDTLYGEDSSLPLSFAFAGNDTIYGGDGNDTIYGDYKSLTFTTGGSDTIYGESGNDIIHGGAGNDLIDGGEGNDILDGGIGVDTLSYALSSGGVYVNLTIMTSPNTTGGAEIDTIANFENIIGSAFDDVLIGNDLNNTLVGGLGHDTIYGGGGNDTIQAGDGNDFIDAGEGIDSIDAGNGDDIIFAGAGDDIIYIGNDDIIAGGSGHDLLDGGTGSDTLSYERISTGVNANLVLIALPGGVDSIIGFENLTGSQFDDILTGDGLVNILRGLGGNDLMYGGSENDIMDGGDGNDTLYGEAGNEMLSGGNGDDILEGGLGDDIIDGGSGNDTASYSTASSRVTIDLSLSSPQNTLGAGIDTLGNIENLIGSSFNDTLTGNDNQNNVIYGGAGNDIIDGGFGSDTLYGGDGNDIINSGDSDVAVGFNISNNILDGGAGNDTLIAGLGHDILIGGDGNDILTGSNGLAGTTISYSTASTSVTVNLSINGAQNTGGAGIDTIVYILQNSDIGYESSIENIIGSSFNDTLTGNFRNNILNGGEGNDNLNGDGGNDTLIGGNGNDYYNGGTGMDIVNFSGSVLGISANIGFGGAQNTGEGMDTFYQVEGLIGSNYDDVLTGTSADNFFQGLGGDDIITGGAGIDTVSYEEVPGPGFGVTVDLRILTAQNTVRAGFDTLSGIENIIGSSRGDVLIGNDVANVISGGFGNDSISGNGGNDTLSSYGSSTINGDDGDDIITGYGISHGGNGNDLIYGRGSMYGDAGNDMLYGYGTMDGGAGNDFLTADNSSNATLTGGEGVDTFVFTAFIGEYLEGNYTITDFSLNDQIIFQGMPSHGLNQLSSLFTFDTTTLPGGTILTSIDDYGNVQGSITFKGVSFSSFSALESLNNTTKNVLTNTYYGTSGDDNLQGSLLFSEGIGYDLGYPDVIYGGDGNDIINTGDGSDILSGGAGSDLFIFQPDSVDGTNFYYFSDHDIVTDFNPAQDHIDIYNPGGSTSLSQWEFSTDYTHSNVGGSSAQDTIISFGFGGGQIVFYDVTFDSIAPYYIGGV